jgi:hypothetical protein
VIHASPMNFKPRYDHNAPAIALLPRKQPM